VSRPLVESVLGPQWIRIRLQNPPHNGLTPELCGQLAQVFQAAADNPEIRAILLEASGKNFCVGADLAWARQQQGGALGLLVRAMNPVCQLILTAPKPVICAVGGVAAGGGMSLCLCADYRIVSHKAVFRLAYPLVGMCLDGGSSFRLPQLVGLSRTQGLLYQDRLVSAAEAREIGLVHEVVQPDRLEEAALTRLGLLAQGPTRAFGESKRLLNPPEWVRKRLEREAEGIERLAGSHDGLQALTAFGDKRIPKFEGR